MRTARRHPRPSRDAGRRRVTERGWESPHACGLRCGTPAQSRVDEGSVNRPKTHPQSDSPGREAVIRAGAVGFALYRAPANDKYCYHWQRKCPKSTPGFETRHKKGATPSCCRARRRLASPHRSHRRSCRCHLPVSKPRPPVTPSACRGASPGPTSNARQSRWRPGQGGHRWPARRPPKRSHSRHDQRRRRRRGADDARRTA